MIQRGDRSAELPNYAQRHSLVHAAVVVVVVVVLLLLFLFLSCGRHFGHVWQIKRNNRVIFFLE